MQNLNLALKIIRMIPKNPNNTTLVVHRYQTNRYIPYITEYIFNDKVKYTQKRLFNGKTLETFEAGKNIFKVLKDIYGNPIRINKINSKGKKSKFDFFADLAYSKIKSNFKNLTDGFIPPN